MSVASASQPIVPFLAKLFLYRRVVAGGKQVGRDVLGLDVLVAVPIGKADPALPHEAEKQLLLLLAMLLPHPFGEIGAAEAPAIALDGLERLGLAMEHGIDRIQRPGLIENDVVAEQALAIEHRSDVVQIIEQKRRRARRRQPLRKGRETRSAR